MRVGNIEVKRIALNSEFKRDNPKVNVDELAANIKAVGLLQPIIVTPIDGGYECLAGNRRLLAAKKLGWDTIPASTISIADGDEISVSLSENIEREQMSGLEIGRWIALATAAHYKQAAVAWKKDTANAGKEFDEKSIAVEVREKIAAKLGLKPNRVLELERAWTRSTPAQRARVKAGKATTTQVQREQEAASTNKKKKSPKAKAKNCAKRIVSATSGDNSIYAHIIYLVKHWDKIDDDELKSDVAAQIESLGNAVAAFKKEWD